MRPREAEPLEGTVFSPHASGAVTSIIPILVVVVMALPEVPSLALPSGDREMGDEPVSRLRPLCVPFHRREPTITPSCNHNSM